MKIVFVTATRPDIIKQAPIFHQAVKQGHQAIILHAAQHFPYSLFEGVYKDMQLPFPPNYSVYFGLTKKIGVVSSRFANYADNNVSNLNISNKLENIALKITNSRPNPAQTAASIMQGCNKLFAGPLKDADIVLVHGDTLAAMSVALSAHLNLIPVGHVEAGLRTFSREPFPEQTNTRCADAASEIKFAATTTNQSNLIKEGFDKNSIYVVGNSVVDAANWAVEHSKKSQEFFNKLGVDFSKPLVYFSAHRRENLMHKERFDAICKSAITLSKKGIQVLWSVRPGTLVAMNTFKVKEELEAQKGIILVSDIPNYTDIMFLISKCLFVITDSGSIQEESAALHIPCVTLRFVTDRPESVQAGINILAPPSSEISILKSVDYVIKNNKKMRASTNPYGNGDTSKKIIDILEKVKSSSGFIRWEHQN